MKNLKQILLVIVIGIFSLGAAAQSTIQSTSNNGGRATLHMVKKASDKKRMPSNIYIEVVYADGAICIYSEQYNSVSNLEFKSSLTEESESIPSITVGEYIPIALNPDEYELTAETPDGKTFSGTMVVD